MTTPYLLILNITLVILIEGSNAGLHAYKSETPADSYVRNRITYSR